MSAAGTKRTSRGCQMSAFGVMSAFDPKQTLLALRKSLFAARQTKRNGSNHGGH